MRQRAFADEDVYELSNSGKTNYEISAQLGASCSLIQKIVSHGRRFGLCDRMTLERKRELSRRQRVLRRIRRGLV